LAAFAAPASAAVVYDLTLDGTTGSALGAGTYGTVSVTSSSTLLDFVVQLSPNFYFNKSTSFQAFDLYVNGTVTTINVTDVNNLAVTTATSGFTPEGPGSFSAPSVINGGPKSPSFNYALTCAAATCGNGGAGLIDELSFNVVGTGLSIGSIDSSTFGVPVFFAADIVKNPGPNAITGNVGAPGPSGVPEPATWAMFILGFGFVGTMLRMARKQQGASLAA
jgi:hypothetical protein